MTFNLASKWTSWKKLKNKETIVVAGQIDAIIYVGAGRLQDANKEFLIIHVLPTDFSESSFVY
jgi:hypothetical protein